MESVVNIKRLQEAYDLPPGHPVSFSAISGQGKKEIWSYIRQAAATGWLPPFVFDHEVETKPEVGKELNCYEARVVQQASLFGLLWFSFYFCSRLWVNDADVSAADCRTAKKNYIDCSCLVRIVVTLLRLLEGKCYDSENAKYYEQGCDSERKFQVRAVFNLFPRSRLILVFSINRLSWIST